MWLHALLTKSNMNKWPLDTSQVNFYLELMCFCISLNTVPLSKTRVNVGGGGEKGRVVLFT